LPAKNKSNQGQIWLCHYEKGAEFVKTVSKMTSTITALSKQFLCGRACEQSSADISPAKKNQIFDKGIP
jgi:hypothetical protein